MQKDLAKVLGMTYSTYTVKQTTTMATKKTTKRRAVARKSASKVTPTMMASATQHYTNNKQSNDHKRQADAARKELYAEMKETKVSNFSFNTNIDGKEVNLTAEIKTPTRVVIDVDILKGLVDAKTFDSIVSATATNVKKFAGEEVLMQVGRNVEGTSNVSVAPTK